MNSVLGGPTYSDGVSQTIQALARQSTISATDMKMAIMETNQTSLLEPFIEPNEIADMVTFLASQEASATNGSALRVDGGVLIGMI